MNLNPNAVIAFPEAQFENQPKLSKLILTRFRINRQPVVGIRAKYIEKVCEVLKIPVSSVSRTRTRYEGVFLAKIKSIRKRTKSPARKSLKEQYVDLLNTQKAIRQKNLVTLINTLERSIHECQETLVMHVRDLDVRRIELKSIQETKKQTPDIRGVEFDKLMAHPDILQIKIDSGNIIVYTKPIEIMHEGKVYDIGQFRIVLSVSTFSVRFHNLTRKVNGCDHPHVRDNGHACLGNIQECLPQMIGACQFAPAIATCIQFLKSYTRDINGHPYYDITGWPKKTRRMVKEHVTT